MATESVHITPNAGEKPSQFAERVGRWYADASVQKDKKHKGQFFTPLAISQFMGNLATPCRKMSVSVLDPGCGLSILSCALIEHLAQEDAPEHISLTLYETDKNVVPLTKEVLSYLKIWCEEKRVALDYHLNESDFVLDKCECLDGDDTIFGEMNAGEKYDYIISNPPYFKLAKDDVHTRSCASIVDGQYLRSFYGHLRQDAGRRWADDIHHPEKFCFRQVFPVFPRLPFPPRSYRPNSLVQYQEGYFLQG